MNRLAQIRSRIGVIRHQLHEMHEGKTFHPWLHEDASEYSALQDELSKLTRQEFMLSHHSGVMSEPMPLHAFRQNGRVEQQPSFMVGMLVFVAFICVLVFFLLATAGVLS